MAHSSARNEAHLEEDDHDSSVSAAMVAVNLISSARLILKLDSVYTQYSAQYLVDKVCPKMEAGLTVKDCLEFALKEGIPKDEDWPHLGCLFKPPSSYKPPLVSMKGKVIETKELKEAYELLVHQPVGAKLHLFTPDIDLVGDGIYCGPSSNETHYVGLRDVIIVEVEVIEGAPIATVKICYKKKVTFIKVDLCTMFLRAPLDDDVSQFLGPAPLIGEFCVPRLSIN